MFDRLEIFRLSGALASHASLTSRVTAENIAQADSPGYRARAVESFQDAFRDSAFAMRATRPGHWREDAPSGARVALAQGAASPDGNTVSIEREMAQAARARMDHDMALGIYRSGLGVLRASLGRR